MQFYLFQNLRINYSRKNFRTKLLIQANTNQIQLKTKNTKLIGAKKIAEIFLTGGLGQIFKFNQNEVC